MSSLELQQTFYDFCILIKKLVVQKDKLKPHETALLVVPQVFRGLFYFRLRR